MIDLNKFYFEDLSPNGKIINQLAVVDLKRGYV